MLGVVFCPVAVEIFKMQGKIVVPEADEKAYHRRGVLGVLLTWKWGE